MESLTGAAATLVAASFVVLFQELALIRWLPSQVRVLAYFPNLVLIAAFLGLGVGSIRAGRRSLSWLWGPSLFALVGAAAAASRVAFTQESTSEHLWLLYYDLPDGAPVVHGVRFPIVVAFVLVAVTFVPLGQIVADRLRVFRRRSSPLWGYVWDLSGSLVGVVGFAALGFAGTAPGVWFGILLVLGAAVVLVAGGRPRWPAVAGAVGVATVVALLPGAGRYSPYYAIDVDEPRPGATAILTNGSLHQYALPMRRDDRPLFPQHREIIEGYHRPYRELADPPVRALVLGAGTGNDVAVLLDEGAESVDAVEIDPVILDLGRRVHPNRPYDSPGVETHVTDARSFLNDTEERYDLIVFGTLDSMTRTSALSNVRLDNFVYTVEALRAARDRLTDDGGLVLYFMVGRPYIDRHLTAALLEAFGEMPGRVARDYGLFNRIYLAGPRFSGRPDLRPPDADRFVEEVAPVTEPPTDDWPYLYLEGRGISPFYALLMAIFGLLAVVAVGVASPEMRRSFGRSGGADLEMFLYGLAFLLLETRFVTAMNLAWGATWLTSAVVFGAILLTVLVSTVVMELRPLPWALAAGGLVVALLATWATPGSLLVRQDPALRLGLSVAVVGLPIFFAAACFALRFRVRERVELAFGWNLLGAVAGGLLEFLSMAVGLEALVSVALLAYLGAFWIRELEIRATAGQPEPSGP